MKRNKKKGFTLVELIAVIAILAILAAVIVPKVSSYTTQATTSTKKANASSILNAVEVYNAQAQTAISNTSTLKQILDATLEDVGSADNDLKETIQRVINANKGIGEADTLTTLAGYIN